MQVGADLAELDGVKEVAAVGVVVEDTGEGVVNDAVSGVVRSGAGIEGTLGEHTALDPCEYRMAEPDCVVDGGEVGDDAEVVSLAVLAGQFIVEGECVAVIATAEPVHPPTADEHIVTV